MLTFPAWLIHSWRARLGFYSGLSLKQQEASLKLLEVLPRIEQVSRVKVGISGTAATTVVDRQLMPLCAISGMRAPVPTGIIANGGMFVGPVQRQVSPVSSTSLPLIAARANKVSSKIPSIGSGDLPQFEGHIVWSTEDYLAAHRKIFSSGRHNFEGAKIPVPTCIRYDRLRDSLGDSITPKELRTLQLLKFGMPLGCDPKFGSKIQLKNHFSAISYKDAINQYLTNASQAKAVLGPFEQAPIAGLCYSPLMSVPKEESKRRVIVDFSFPSGSSINDGIPSSTYLDSAIEFNLPSVQTMVSRLNELGTGCLLYKRDLKGAFRQFNIDPGDYILTGLHWDGKAYVDTRLAMGLRSSAYCCQAVTEMVAKIAGKQGHVLVYLDDFGGAEIGEKAYTTFTHLGSLLKYFGLEEAAEKAVAPTTCMDWLGIRFDTEEWTMALKPGKLEELLCWLPRLLRVKRVKKAFLQRILGNLVWASSVVRAGVIFFNRLLALLRKLKRPHHSIHFSVEAKKDVMWWIDTLKQSKGKSPIPPAVWTPLVSFSTDASLQGFGMVWGNRALAGIFTSEFDELDISKKEMLAVMVAIKQWFAELAGLRVKIFIDNSACVSLINYGVTKSPFLAACLREIQYFLSKFNIEIRAEYIPSKQNFLADLCSRAFSSDVYFENFKKMLDEGTLILECVNYNMFNFEYVN